MRSFILLLAIVVSFAAVSTGCNSRDNKSLGIISTTQGVDGADRISIATLKTALDSGNAVVVDVRGQAQYDAGHIKGALLIPLTDIANRVNDLPHDKEIVTYCSCPAEHSSAAAVLSLKQKGISNAAALVGGYEDWKNAGLPTETSIQGKSADATAPPTGKV